MLQQGQVMPGPAMYPMQQAYPSGLAVPQYGYMPQHAIYQAPPGAYLGDGRAYAPARGYQQQQQPPQTQPDYNCQVGPGPAGRATVPVPALCLSVGPQARLGCLSL